MITQLDPLYADKVLETYIKVNHPTGYVLIVFGFGGSYSEVLGNWEIYLCDTMKEAKSVVDEEYGYFDGEISLFEDGKLIRFN